MAAACEDCFFQQTCLRMARADGRNATGVWGGVYFDYGREVDPFDTAKSLYRGVHWDRVRGRFKTEFQRNGIRFNLPYTDDEEEGARLVNEFKAEHGWTEDR